MRAIVIWAAVSLLVGGNAFAAAPSRCDSGITKAVGKKVACKTSVIARAQQNGTTPDGFKLTACTNKFDKSCQKAKSAGDCKTQTQTCAQIETEADSCVNTVSSPSGAFLE